MKTTYGIDGMTCGGCVSSLEKAFASQLPEVEIAVTLDEGGRLFVQGEHEKASVQTIVEDAGFDIRD